MSKWFSKDSVSSSTVAEQALELLRAWTPGQPEEADETRMVCAIDTVLRVHELAREKIERKTTP